MDELPKPWLIEGVLRQDTLVMLSAQPKVAKSLLSLDMAQAVCSGESWHGRAVQQGNVLFVAAEGGDLLGPRARALKQCQRAIPPQTLRVVQQRIPFIDDDATQQFLLEHVEGFLPRLVVIDTAARCMDGLEIDPREVTRFCTNVDKIREACGSTILLIHHNSKGRNAKNGEAYGGDSYRGCTAWEASVNAWFSLEKSRKEATVTLKPRSGHHRYDFAFTFAIESIKSEWSGSIEEEPVLRLIAASGGSASEKKKKVTLTVKDYTEALKRHGELNKSAWGRAVGETSTGNRQLVVDECLILGLVSERQGRGREKLYRLIEDAQPPIGHS